MYYNYNILMYYQVSVDINNVSFGSVCVGETVNKVITAHNMGALPTNIRFILMDTTPTQQSVSNN